MGKKILIADDEQEIIELLSLYLEKDGFGIIEAYDGIMALELLKVHKIDIALIDIMMPNMDGYQLIRKIRKEYKIPVIILSAKSEYSDRILGLELGADDYVTKPFNPLEVEARIKAQLRRFYEFNDNEKESSEEKFLILGDLKLDTVKCALYKNGVEISITATEYKLLKMLMENCERVFTKKQIFENVWDEVYYGDDNTIMVHISKLRDKIEDDSKNPVYLRTIRGIGYKIEGKVASAKGDS